MALSPEFVQRHIRDQSKRLKSPYFPHRQLWPAKLFHHAPLENAVSILQDGNLRSRRDPQNALNRDIAGAGVIDASDAAKDFVRLYFRPKTPTQYHIEGVRRQGECGFGAHAHAPVLVMFVLEAQSVLTRPDVKFSARNMQSCGAIVQETEHDFSAIPFDKVYHEGGIGEDKSIIAHRCAEVLTSSPLPLPEVLSRIWFRSAAERDTLLHLLGNESARWARYCDVSDALKVFEKRHAFFDAVTLTSDGLAFVVNDRFDNGTIQIEFNALNLRTNESKRFTKTDQRTRHEKGNRWIFRFQFPDGNYLVEGKLEGHVAYKAYQMVGDSIF